MCLMYSFKNIIILNLILDDSIILIIHKFIFLAVKR